MKIETKKEEIQNPTSNKSSFETTILNVMKSAMCSGMIMLPANYYNGGYIATSLQMIFYSFLIIYLVFLQSDVTQDYYRSIQMDQSIDEFHANDINPQNQDFSNLVTQHIGQKYEPIYQIVVAVMSFSLGIVYAQIIYKSLVKSAHSMDLDIPQTAIFIFVLILLFFICALFNDFDKMRITSVIGLGFLILNAIVFSIYSIDQINQGIHQKYSDKVMIVNWDEQFMISANVVYLFEYIQNVNSLRMNMQQPERFKTTIKIAHLAMFLIYSIFGILVSYGIQSKPADIYFFDYNQKKKHWIFLFQQLYVIIIITTFPLNINCAFLALEKTKAYESIQDPDSATSFIRKNCVKLVVLVGVFIIIALDIKITIITSLINPLIIYFLQFFFPVIVYNIHFQEQENLSAQRKYFNILVLIFGLAISILSIKDSIIKLVHSK